MAPFTPRRIGLVVSGALVAGVAATLLQVLQVHPAYAIVVGLSGAMPVLLEGMRPVEGKLDRGSRLQMAFAEILGALTAGMFGAFALVLAEVAEPILAAGATLFAYLGGFFARSAVTGDDDDGE